MGPRFSLVMTTTGRVEEVRRLLESLRSQTYKAFELIVVDQSEGDEVEALCRGFSDLHITHTRTPRVGVSRARNLGIPAARGEIIAVPDDDCEYPEDLLARVDEYLRSRPDVDGVSGISRDKVTGDITVAPFDLGGGMVSLKNLWRRHTSASMFLRRAAWEKVGLFDEQLGVGSRFGSSEDTDFLLRVLRGGFRIAYCPEICVYHPNPVACFDARAVARAYSYGLGLGAVLRKHIFGYRALALVPRAAALFTRPLVACMTYALLDRGRCRFYFASLKGRLVGFCRYSTEQRRLGSS